VTNKQDMAWNESGGGDKDPWTSRGNKNGGSPPDLDEVVRNLQRKLGGLFGGKGGGGSDGSGFGMGGRGISLFLILALIIWGLSGIYIVDEGTRGLVTRFGEYSDTTLPGPHWRIPTPIDRVEIVNVEKQRVVEVGYRSGGRSQAGGSVPREALMLTEDENIVDIKLAVQYQVSDAKNYLFNVRDPDLTLKQATESALREVIGKSSMDFVLKEGRAEVVTDTKIGIQSILDLYKAGLRVISVNLQDAQPPEEVQGAFEDAIRAREDEQRLINEAEAYSNEVIPKARGGAARQLEEASAYREEVIARSEGDASRFNQLLTEYEKAPEITRQRLYLEAMESVLANTNKVMLDAQNGNSLFYLPLDQIIKSGAVGGGSGSIGSSSGSTISQPVRSSTNRNRDDARRRIR